MPAQRRRINATESVSEHAKETRLDSECLLLEISGQTWYIPFDTLERIPRVGETIQGMATEMRNSCRANMLFCGPSPLKGPLPWTRPHTDKKEIMITELVIPIHSKRKADQSRNGTSE